MFFCYCVYLLMSVHNCVHACVCNAQCVCVCVCMCTRMHAYMCECVCERERVNKKPQKMPALCSVPKFLQCDCFVFNIVKLYSIHVLLH